MMWTIPGTRNERIADEEGPGLTLSLVGHAEIGEAKFFDVLLERGALSTRVGFIDEGLDGLEVFARGGAAEHGQRPCIRQQVRCRRTGCCGLRSRACNRAGAQDALHFS
jgi:hypothetical protein